MPKKKILYLISTYTKNMGYIYVCLPEAMSKIKDVEVHVLTSQAQMYYDSPYYKETYQEFHGEPILPVGKEKLANDLYLHRIEFDIFKTELYLKNLYSAIHEIKPDVIHTFDCNSINSFKLACLKPVLGYKFFPGNSIVLSVFPLDKNWKDLSLAKKIGWQIKHVLPGMFISFMANRIFPSTVDAGYIAINYLGAKKSKVEISPLGVDTTVFSPVKDNDEKIRYRVKHSMPEDHFICIYTGRMTKEKNPLLLAQAVELINKTTDLKIKSLFLGEGVQKEEIEKLDSSIVLGFKNFKELAYYYKLSDLGVWPTQESTSMIDAAACGLPIIVSDRLKATERIEGNGVQYLEGDVEDLALKIIELYKDKDRYNLYSKTGAKKMEEEYSWNKIAKDKLIAYEKY